LIAFAFRDAYRMRHQRIAIFTALPIRNREQRLREIGRIAWRQQRVTSRANGSFESWITFTKAREGVATFS
jgi:hypothetical protein